MIVKQYIKDFEKLGFGMFVHFGLYSEIGEGEWIMELGPYTREEYYSRFNTFCPASDWAEKLVSTAKAAGCKYITLTTRHHDGFSLYDTCGLNDLDAPHSSAGRDLVREFVDACNAQGLTPFFYHTLLDWYMPSYNENFKDYLVYLRKSVEILCKNYGKIGGIWFDGMWNKPGEDWEEDALYSTIRSYQPEAMIINNTGLDARGSLGHIELDSVTFERGRPGKINMEDSPKYIASEMCQTLGGVWGYSSREFHIKSLPELIEDLCVCRRFGSNFLLNVGPMPSGYLRPIDDAMLRTLGEWVDIQNEAIYLPRPSGIEIEGESRAKDFILKGEDAYYLFYHGLVMSGDANVVIASDRKSLIEDRFEMEKTVTSMKWLDDGTDVDFEQKDGKVIVSPGSYRYGTDLVVRIAKIETK